MAKDRPTLNVEPRTTQGSRNTRRLRRQGLVPGVVYGHGEEARPFQANARDLRALLNSPAAFFDLSLDGKASPVIVKDQQLQPVRDDEVMHVDMIRVNLDETIQTTVLVELHGAEEAPGVREGGVLEQVTREVNIEALPLEVPEHVELDVTGMGVGDSLRVGDLPPIEGVRYLDDPDETVLATVTLPTRVVEPEEMLAEGEEPATPLPEQEPQGGSEAPLDPGGDASGSPGTVSG